MDSMGKKAEVPFALTVSSAERDVTGLGLRVEAEVANTACKEGGSVAERPEFADVLLILADGRAAPATAKAPSTDSARPEDRQGPWWAPAASSSARPYYDATISALLHALYRGLDKLLERKTALFDNLRQRWPDLFGASFELLLYE
jgi:hypothetical protein